MADFKKLSSVETVNEVTDNMSLLIENNGNINRVSKDLLAKPADWETMKNKPFDIEKKLILLTEGTLSDNGAYRNLGISNIVFEYDFQYTFVIDDVEYSGIAYFDDTDVSMCVPLIRASDGWTVAWAYQSHDYIYLDHDAFDVNVPHKIEYLEKTYHCIDDMLISNNIPKVIGKAYVGQVLRITECDENNMPTEWTMQSPAQSRRIGYFRGDGVQTAFRVNKDEFDHNFYYTRPTHAFIYIRTETALGKSFKIYFGDDDLIITSSVVNTSNISLFYIECVFTGIFTKVRIYENTPSSSYNSKGRLKDEFVSLNYGYLRDIKVSLSDDSAIPSGVEMSAYVY